MWLYEKIKEMEPTLSLSIKSFVVTLAPKLVIYSIKLPILVQALPENILAQTSTIWIGTTYHYHCQKQDNNSLKSIHKAIETHDYG